MDILIWGIKSDVMAGTISGFSGFSISDCFEKSSFSTNVNHSSIKLAEQLYYGGNK